MTAIAHERRTDKIDFSKLVFHNEKLIELEDSKASNHTGGSLLVITKDAKIVYQRQGILNDVDPGLLAPSSSGSLDWSDFKQQMNFRSLIVSGLERELREEIDGKLGPLADYYTFLTGYGRVLHRGAKPEFCGLTLLNQNFSELRVRPRENGYVAQIYNFQLGCGLIKPEPQSNGSELCESQIG